jgi:hypothetical protein
VFEIWVRLHQTKKVVLKKQVVFKNTTKLRLARLAVELEITANKPTHITHEKVCVTI